MSKEQFVYEEVDEPALEEEEPGESAMMRALLPVGRSGWYFTALLSYAHVLE